MDVLTAVLAIIVAIALLFEVARRIGVPYPSLFVLGGLALGFVPGLPRIHARAGARPARLPAAAAVQRRDRDADPRPQDRRLRRSSGSPSGSCCSRWSSSPLVVHFVIGLDWAPSFAFGAIVGPTDAIAATTVFRRIGMPRRVVDARRGRVAVQRRDRARGVPSGRPRRRERRVRARRTRSAGSRSPTVGGIAIGSRRRLAGRRAPSPAGRPAGRGRSISLVVPFAAYLPAERLGVSGVLAAVAAGLVVGSRLGTILDREQPDPVAEHLEDGRVRPERVRVRADRAGAAADPGGPGRSLAG